MAIEHLLPDTPPETLIDISAQYDGSQVTISVADRGPGIPPADLERIFDKFYRIHSTHRTGGSLSGSGLGLAVCRGVIEAHGRRIWAEPRSGGGVVFFIAFPVNAFEGVMV